MPFLLTKRERLVRQLAGKRAHYKDYKWALDLRWVRELLELIKFVRNYTKRKHEENSKQYI